VRAHGIFHPVRRIPCLTERSIDARGQHLLVSEIVLDGWTASLLRNAGLKTEMDIERPPSGKFDTNYLACQLTALTLNILLHLIGQQGLPGPHTPIRHPAKRWRIKTMIQELILLAARIIGHGRQRWLRLGANDRAAIAFIELHAQIAASG